MNFKNSLVLFMSLFLLSACSRDSEKGAPEEETSTKQNKLSELKEELSTKNEEMLKTKDKASCRSVLSQIEKLEREIFLVDRIFQYKGFEPISLDPCTDNGYSPEEAKQNKLSELKEELSKGREELLQTRDKASCQNLFSQVVNLNEKIAKIEKGNIDFALHYPPEEGIASIAYFVDSRISSLSYLGPCTDNGYSPTEQ